MGRQETTPGRGRAVAALAAAVAALAASAASTQPASSRKPVGTPVRYEQVALTCKLLSGAATSAPDGTDPRYVQQVLVRNDKSPSSLVGTQIDYVVHRHSVVGQVTGRLAGPPRLNPGAWVRVSEAIGGLDCSATVTVALPLIEGRLDRALSE